MRCYWHLCQQKFERRKMKQGKIYRYCDIDTWKEIPYEFPKRNASKYKWISWILSAWWMNQSKSWINYDWTMWCHITFLFHLQILLLHIPETKGYEYLKSVKKEKLYLLSKYWCYYQGNFKNISVQIIK